MKNLLSIIGVTTLSVFFMVGCTDYYKVTDPTTGATYYTTDSKSRDGSVQFTDEKTGSKVLIQNAEVKEISKSEYKQAVD